MSRPFVALVFLLLLSACPAAEIEGDESGECDDGVDNDLDGTSDCDDEDCAGVAGCTADDDDAADDDDDDSGDSSDDDDSAYDRTDEDGDSYPVELGDCDDSDPTVHPGAVEVPYDGVDQDCDGEDLVDVDEDGYDAAIVGGDDCDDEDETVHPDAEDTPYDGVDQDCDGASDFDVDGDGYPSADHGGDDCDDDLPLVHPGAPDPCGDGLDANCSGDDGVWVPDDIPTIGEALTTPRPDGEAICVSAGTYPERLDFAGDEVHLTGIDGAENTVLDGGCGGSVLTFDSGETADTIVEGFTITNGCAEAGGGVYIHDSSPTLRQLRVEGNQARHILDLTVDGDFSALARGGGIYVGGTGAPTLSNLVIADNTANAWIEVWGDSYSIIESEAYGGGIFAAGNGMTVSNTVIRENTSTSYATTYLFGCDSFYGRAYADSWGGGAHVTGGSAFSTLNTVFDSNNLAVEAAAYRICDGASGSVYDYEDSGGGAVAVSSGSASFQYSDFWSAYNTPASVTGVGSPLGSNGNVSVDPGYLDAAEGDYHLDNWSPLLDAGDPAVTDPDGSRSDIGAYGGPYGAW